MIKVILCGAMGRMGSLVAKLTEEDEELSLFACVERKGHPKIGYEVASLMGLQSQGLLLQNDLSQVIDQGDVVIDFSTPSGVMEHVQAALRARKAMVIGVTGFDEAQKKAIEEASRSIACLLSPNMSLGVNLLFRLVKEAVRALGPDYDVEIEELHHRHKADAPSGTALRLAHVIQEAQNLALKKEEALQFGRKGVGLKRQVGEIGLHSLRAGDVVGEHRVILAGMGECLELTHRALSRDAFARGALSAAKFLYRKPPGLYQMAEVLGLT